MSEYMVYKEPNRYNKKRPYVVVRDGELLSRHGSEKEAWEAATEDEAGYTDMVYDQVRDERMESDE